MAIIKMSVNESPKQITLHDIKISITADDPIIIQQCYTLVETYLSTLTNNNTFLSSSKIQTTTVTQEHN